MSGKYIFSDEDYKSGDGMLTSVWGPPLWHTLHTISFNYPINPTSEQKKQYYNFYNNLQNVLPCRYCRENLAKNLKSLPLNMDVFKNRDSLSRYVYNLHELVNKMLGKDSGLSFEDVRDRYEHFRSRCVTTNPSVIEKGCTEPLYGVKSKCVLNIVPKDTKTKSFNMDPKCILKKSSKKPSKKQSKTKKHSKSHSKKLSKSHSKKASKK